MIVREAVEAYLRTRPSRRSESYLWVSDLGTHPQKVMRRIVDGESPDFSLDTLVRMESGNALEAATVDALRFNYPGVLTQFPLYNDIWSGYADVVLNHQLPGATIIEHKATSDKWWNYKGKGVAKSTHVCQLWLYGRLYENMFGVRPRLVLYYRAWGNWAEFHIDQESTTERMVLRGTIDGSPAVETFDISPYRLRLELESFWQFPDGADSLPEDPNTWNYPEEAHLRLIAAYGSVGGK